MEAAFGEHADDVLRFCRRRISDREAAKDLTQESFARLWAALSRGEDIRNPRAYLFTVAGNLAKNHLRDRKPTASLETLREEGFDVGDPDADAARTPSEESTFRFVSKTLGEPDGTIVGLRFVSGLPVSEIAAALGMSRVGVSVRIHRAIKKLRTHFHED